MQFQSLDRELSFPPADFNPPKDICEARSQDIDFLHVVFAKLNHSFTTDTRRLFGIRLQKLRQHLSDMTHGEFVMGISKAVAAANDGHTRILIENHVAYAPVRFHWFSDGLYIVRAQNDVAELLGAKVIAIGGSSPDSILKILSGYLGGTAEHIRALSAELMNSPDVLQGIGVLAHDEQLNIQLRMENGAEVGCDLGVKLKKRPKHWYRNPEFDVAAVPVPREGWRHVLESLPNLPLYLQMPEQHTHDALIPDISSLYLRMNATTNCGSRYLDDYLDDVLTNVQNKSIQNFIVDVRFNQGGNYLLVQEFAKRLPDLLREDGRIYIITGNHTFSAGLVIVALLKYYAKGRALILGQRVGDRERFWAEGGVIELPNSGLPVCFTDGYHNWFEGCKDDSEKYPWFNQLYAVAAGSLVPDIEVSLNFSDYREGRDGIMERVELLAREDGSTETS